MRLLPFKKKPLEPTTDDKGLALYNLYREARIAQGWEEFKWTSMSTPQKLVWNRVAAILTL